MSSPPADRPNPKSDPTPSPRRVRTVLALLLALAPLAALGAGPLAATLKPTVDSPHGTFKEDCSLCHGANGWKPAKVSSKFDHEKRSGFKLDGAHATAACTSCHTSLDFKKSRTQCASCHEDPHRGEMGPDCASCHTPRSFVDRAAMARRHQMTRFPLTGGHAGLDCESCHRPASQGHLQFVGTEAECVNCHRSDYDNAKNPDHKGGGFPVECAECHSPTSWNSARFDHSRTRFPLTGAHTSAACASCHGDGVYAGKNTACSSCHIGEYNGTTSPAHAAAGYSTACETCHNTTSWAGANFDHSQTAFPLTGAHRSAPCASCHGDGVYAGKSTDCSSCHMGDYNTTSNPGHAAAGFSTACATCHTTTAWTGATFDHDGPFFPIYSGTHRGRWTACTDCHTNLNRYTEFNCLACHPHDDKAQTDAKHVGRAGYSYDSRACYNCHPRGTH